MSSENKSKLEYTKERAAIEASKYLPTAKDKVVVVMPFEAAWIDPTEEGMESIRDFASTRGGSVFEFSVEKQKIAYSVEKQKAIA